VVAFGKENCRVVAVTAEKKEAALDKVRDVDAS